MEDYGTIKLDGSEFITSSPGIFNNPMQELYEKVNNIPKISDRLLELEVKIEDLETDLEEHLENYEKLKEVVSILVSASQTTINSFNKLKEYQDNIFEHIRKVQESDTALHELHNKRLTSNSNWIGILLMFNIVMTTYYSGDLSKIVNYIMRVFQ